MHYHLQNYRLSGRRTQWSRLILLGLLDVGEAFIEVMLSTSYKGSPTILPKRTIGSYYALRRLEKSGYVRRVAGAKRRYKLTLAGRRRALKLRLYRKPAGQQVWDGKWRVLIFDVPERRRAARDFLRRELRLFEFKQLHRSVWVSPFDIPANFQELLGEAGLKFDTRLLIVEKINYDADLRRWFNLPTPRHLSDKSSRS